MRLNITHKGLVERITSRAVITSVDSGLSADVTALWDTGATRSLINEKFAIDLQLRKAGVVPVNHLAGTNTFQRYFAGIEIQGGMIIPEHKLVAFPNIHVFDMIIGMDIIKLGRFRIENKNGNTFFSFNY